MITRDKRGRLPSSVDPELCPKHDYNGQLVCIMTKHMDDLKIAGVPPHCPRDLDEAVEDLQLDEGSYEVVPQLRSATHTRRSP